MALRCGLLPRHDSAHQFGRHSTPRSTDLGDKEAALKEEPDPQKACTPMSLSETTFADPDSDTLDLHFERGNRVVVTSGDLSGVEGTVVAFRADAHVLVRLRRGVYVEVLRFCLAKLR